jgi:benzoyl-CoA 2,3-dioxygenase component B
MTAVITDEKIPNNVNLAGDRRLQRALEEWQPHFLSWWQDMGPVGFQTKDIYLRTAVSVESDGWAHFDYVKMPDYRWGIFLEPKQEGRIHGFGDFHGQPVWDEVPGEFRNLLRRLIVTQGDTEPASVEQQRHLGRPRRRSTTCATCSRSTSRRAATCGRWSTCSTPTSAATAARRPRSS